MNDLPQDYLYLVSRIRAIDPSIAWYLMTKAPELPGFVACGKVDEVFVWSSTPQGNKFWEDIHTRLSPEPVKPGMVEVKERPTVGQWVEVWEYDGEVWSGTYMWSKCGQVLRYNAEEDTWTAPSDKVFQQIKYFLLK